MKKFLCVLIATMMVIGSVWAEHISFYPYDFSGYDTKVITATDEETQISVSFELDEDAWINCDTYLSVKANGGKFTLTASTDADATITGITLFFANDSKYNQTGIAPIIGYAFNSYSQVGEGFNMYGMIVSVQVDYTLTTALSDVETNKNIVSKIIENGRIVIIQNGVRYSTTGQQINL